MKALDSPAEVIARRERLKSLIVAQAFSRMLHKAIDCYDTDLETCAIRLAVACASTGALLRDPKFLKDLDDPEPVPDEHHRPVSRRAIAASTGLPRETVRRKIALLVEQGLLTEEPDGVRTASGVLHRGRAYEFASALAREITRASVQLARIDQMAELEARQGRAQAVGGG